ncbi:hypothetical protein N7510_005464 [Penicillium lagena]|uniref:uncharacterized protein n=1 Tax=Penicillium lagena TaxID=94218 RepID=UPI00254217C8|nr:uncharacterized protein N7510_005464 [Penicillium lagena]KAJ5612270.1 hypothetical protein N7510_005464 [Penicillium lagena]
MEYEKHFIPLESDPKIFTSLMHNLGVTKSFKFIDIWSLETEQLDNIRLEIQSPIEALVLILPDCPAYAEQSIGNSPDSFIDGFMKETPGDRAQYLHNSPELDTLYRKAALFGTSEPPAAESEVDHHYICLVRHSGCLYELDGDRTGPIYRGNLEDDEDTLSEKGCDILKMYMNSCPGGCFSLLALINSS